MPEEPHRLTNTERIEDMAKLKKYEEAWIYINVLVSLLLLVIFGWKAALVEFLAIGIASNIVKFIRNAKKGQ